MHDNPTAGELTELRANAQVIALHVSNWPEYGTYEWLKLNPSDPRVYAATLEAAEWHRITVERNHATAFLQALMTQRESAEAKAKRRLTTRNRAPHKLTATAGWPPIQIPGRPGEYLTYQETSE
ncbi:DUF2742 domain-containing protein [Streptomyces sp. NPDC102383]|uniref:DUF2742 domain-containing protein n=1 Tax=Streptomyces sp. NPDC102383 TaxID=3366165 RepID=UPI00381DDCB7